MTKQNNTEILAPAGCYDALIAGVRMGADAVYLGTKAFNARQGADNFGGEQLDRAVAYCHARNTRVHVTLNTLVADHELSTAVEEIKHVCTAGADVLILQDLGLARLAMMSAPELERHASTQMTVQTPAGIRLLHALGYQRVVLPRETSQQEITEICEKSEIQVECFIHGALCMCVSGQCYLSAMLGSRSGNRGLCAQPCRLPFQAYGGTGFDLSLKDLSYVQYIKEMSALGVRSFKIEGRMKRPEYVAAAVHACRKSLSGEDFSQQASDLQAVFSRSGFTDGYWTGQKGREMFGIRRKEDVVSAKDVLSKLARLYDREQPRIGVDFFFTMLKGEPVSLSARAGKHTVFVRSEVEPEPARNLPLNREMLSQRLAKCGSTPFFIKECDFDWEDGLTVPVSVINALRREALEKLLAKLEVVIPKAFIKKELHIFPHRAKPCCQNAFFMNVDSMPDDLSGIDTVYVPLDTSVQRLREIQKQAVKVGIALPRGLFGLEQTIKKQLAILKQEGFDLAYCQNLDALQIAKEAGMKIHTGFGLNIFNSVSLSVLEDLGVEQATVSFELPLNRAQHLGGELKRGIIAYGRLPLMLTRNCPLKNGRTCAQCDKKGYLTDRMGVQFPVRCFYGCSELLNSRPIYLADRLDEIKNMDFITLYFTVENKLECAKIIKAYQNAAPCTMGEYTRGLYYRGVL